MRDLSIDDVRVKEVVYLGFEDVPNLQYFETFHSFRRGAVSAQM